MAASIEDLEWTVCDELLEDLLKNPKVQLPQLIKLSQKVSSVDGKEHLEKDQIILIHGKHTLAKLEGTSFDGSLIRLPVNCPYGVHLKIPPGREKNYDSISVLAKTDPLPKFVEVTNSEGLESISVGDRLKVVIAEKSGGAPTFVHFRSSSGKHVKISVDQDVSFKLAVNDASEQLLAKIAEKSRELPVAAQFVKDKSVPPSHLDLGVFTITKGFMEQVIIASGYKLKEEYVVVFPLSADIKFQVNSKLKMATDKDYRELCTKYSNVDVSDVIEYLNMASPADKETFYVTKRKKLSNVLSGSHESDLLSSNEKLQVKQESIAGNEEEKQNGAKFKTLSRHQDQQEIIKKEQKERERLAKLEKERLKAERKRVKKESKKRVKEEKKKKKVVTTLQRDEHLDSTDDIYIQPNSPTPSAPTSPTSPNGEDYEDTTQAQWALHLMSKVKNVRDRTLSLGFKPKKKNKLTKEDISFCSSDNVASFDHYSIYTGLKDDPFENEDLYETLPGDVAYESLDLIRQAQRSLAVQSEHNGDSGFDEIDQAKIKAWRESMQPPPLPGNHPHQAQIDHPSDNNDNEDIYEVAVDSSVGKKLQENLLKNFYSIVEQSTNEISSWGMDNVSDCLQDLKLGQYKQVFIDSYVDGQLLLDLDESVLNDLGLTLFEARKLRKFVYGWRPDAMRPSTYPELKGFQCDDPSEWNEKDVASHLKIIDINDVADFCQKNQVNGELLKDLCVDDTIMNSIITTRDRKLKIVKLKNYVIDKWRPKKKGEGNYSSYTPVNKSPQVQKSHSTASVQRTTSTNSQVSPSTRGRKVSDNNTPLGLGKKPAGADAPLIARMKQQLEENAHNWQSKKH